MNIGYLQFNPELCKPALNASKVRKMLDAEKNNFDLLVMPELANSGYFFSSKAEATSASEEIPNGNFCRTLIELSKSRNAHIVSGICERARNKHSDDKLYNSAILVSPSGEINTYRKAHLFLEEKLWFTPGDTGFNVFEISGDYGIVKVGMMICFDWIFPEAARTLALKEAQIIAHPSNLVLQYCQKAMFTRAIENRVFTVTANRIGTETKNGKELFYTGASVIIDTKGNYLSTGSDDKEEISIVDIDPTEALDKNITPLNNIFEDRRTDLYE